MDYMSIDISALLCALFGHVWGGFTREGVTGHPNYKIFHYRLCKRCGAEQVYNHLSKKLDVVIDDEIETLEPYDVSKRPWLLQKNKNNGLFFQFMPVIIFMFSARGFYKLYKFVRK